MEEATGYMIKDGVKIPRKPNCQVVELGEYVYDEASKKIIRKRILKKENNNVD